MPPNAVAYCDFNFKRHPALRNQLDKVTAWLCTG
jgi:hypothetical protein